MARNTDPLLTLPDKSGVLYVRLYQRMRALILDGAWPTGMRLPSSRRLAEDLGISRNTASLALDQLLADGCIETRMRAGTFVAAMPIAGSTDRVVDEAGPLGRPPVPFELSQGAIDAFPLDRWARLQSKVWSNFVPDLLYDGDLAGDRGLRQAIAMAIAPRRGISVSAEDLVIVTSTSSAFDLIAAALPAGGTVIVEDPGYHFTDAAFRQRGCQVVPVPVDQHGLDVVAAQRAAPQPAAIVVSPNAQFPIGVPLSTERRQALLAWARATGAWIIEDSFDAEQRFDGVPSPHSLKAENSAGKVICVASLSRQTFRSLRLGFLAATPELRGKMLAARAAADAFVPLPNQLVLREFIERGLMAAHQRRCRELYRDRRETLVNALKPYLGTLFDEALNPCGLHLLLRPRTASAEAVANALRGAGIACTTLAQLTRQPPAAEGVLLGFGAFSPDVIDASRSALAGALDPLLKG